MSSILSAEAVPFTNDRASDGRFARNNPGGPGNPFARQTAALRAALVNGVTEQDIQDILDILLLNAKGGHLPTIKFLFSYLIGKPKPVVEPDTLDLQEMQQLQQSALPPEALETVCAQLPLDLRVQLTRFAQAENAATAFQTALDNDDADATPPSPSAPSTDGDNGVSEVAEQQKPPSTNGAFRQPTRLPRMAGFNWLGDLRRAFGGVR